MVGHVVIAEVAPGFLVRGALVPDALALGPLGVMHLEVAVGVARHGAIGVEGNERAVAVDGPTLDRVLRVAVGRIEESQVRGAVAVEVGGCHGSCGVVGVAGVIARLLGLGAHVLVRDVVGAGAVVALLRVLAIGRDLVRHALLIHEVMADLVVDVVAGAPYGVEGDGARGHQEGAARQDEELAVARVGAAARLLDVARLRCAQNAEREEALGTGHGTAGLVLGVGAFDASEAEVVLEHPQLVGGRDGLGAARRLAQGAAVDTRPADEVVAVAVHLVGRGQREGGLGRAGLVGRPDAGGEGTVARVECELDRAVVDSLVIEVEHELDIAGDVAAGHRHIRRTVPAPNRRGPADEDIARKVGVQAAPVLLGTGERNRRRSRVGPLRRVLGNDLLEGAVSRDAPVADEVAGRLVGGVVEADERRAVL